MDLDPFEESTLMSKDHVLRGTYSLSNSLEVDISGIRHLNTFVYACSLKANLLCAACMLCLTPLQSTQQTPTGGSSRAIAQK